MRRRRPTPQPRTPEPLPEHVENLLCALAFDRGGDPKLDPRLIGDPDYLAALRGFWSMPPASKNGA